MASRLKRPVGPSADLKRVLGLPSREWQPRDAQRVADYMTRQLLTPKGLATLARFDLLAPSARAEAIAEFGRTTCPIALTEDQGVILYEWIQQGQVNLGVLALAPVGAGKTLLLILAMTIAERWFGAARMAILLPAYLRDDALAAYQVYSEYWKLPAAGAKLITYSEIGVERNAFILCDCDKCLNGHEKDPDVDYTPAFRPQVIGLDEADVMASESSAGAQRMARFQDNHRDELRTIAATGTLVQDSLSEMFRLFAWTLKENAPIPYEWEEQQLWCAAMDPVEGRRGRASPEYLIKVFGGSLDADDPHAEARRAYGRRLRLTRGFVVVNKSSCDTPLHIRVVPAPRDAAIEQGLIPFRKLGRAHDDYIIGDTLSKCAYEESFSCGYYDKWDPRPPIEWLAARNAYNEAVAEVIKRASRGGYPIETEKQARRLLKDSRELREWIEISTCPGAYVPNPVPVAISLSVIHWIAEWLRINSPAIVWVDGSWLGETLEAVTGVPYYSKDGLNKAKRKPSPGESVIASLKSNYRGRNWQAWNRMLVTPVLSSNKWQEQVIGRAHRQGQREAVFVDYLVTCHASLRAFEKAQDRAKGGTYDLFGLTQKVIATEWDWSAVPNQIRDPSGCGITDEGFLARWWPKGLADRTAEEQDT